MSTRIVALLIGLLVSLAPCLRAEDSPEPKVERGFASDKLYSIDGIESVDLSSGSLTLSLPIGNAYPVSEVFSYRLNLLYSSGIWDFEKEIYDNDKEFTVAIPNRTANAGVGWRLSMGDLYAPYNFEESPMEGSWVFVSPDGAQHRFFDTLHEHDISPSTDSSYTYMYTRDGSYLRMQYQPGLLTARKVEYPDGTEHTFECLTQTCEGNDPLTCSYRLTRIQDTHGSYLNITYDGFPATRWTINDSQGRDQVINLVQMPSGELGRSTYFVDEVRLTAAGGTAVYDFSYSTQYIQRSSQCLYPDPAVCPDNVWVALLDTITMPDGTTFDMSYNQANDGADQTGTIQSLTLPTLGSLEWTYQTYVHSAAAPTPGAKDQVPNPSGFVVQWPGLLTRSHHDRDGSLLAEWHYQTWTGYTPNVLTIAEERRTVVTSPDGTDTVYYFREASDDFSLPGVTIWDYALPFTRRTSTAITSVCGSDLLLSSEQFDGSIASVSATPVVGATGVLKIRTRCVRYEHDSFHPMMITDKDGSYRSLNRYLASERTVDHDSGGETIREVHRYDFDGFGHYRVTVTDGNLEAGNQRKAVRSYAHDLGLGTGLDAYTYKIKDGNILASSVADDDDAYPGFPGIESPRHTFLFDTSAHIHPWLLNLYDAEEVWEDDGDGTWEGHEVARTERCLDEDTGFLQRTRRLESGVTRGVHDVIVANTADADGNTTRTRYFGGDTQTVGTGELCDLELTGPQYNIRRLHASGTLHQSYYDNGYGGLIGSFYLTDDDIDASTGLVSASRDVSGRQIDYTYDLMGRVTWVKPQEANQAWTKIVYTAATPSSAAQATVIQYPHGQTSGPLAQKRYRYDGLGRLASEGLLQPDSTWNQRLTTFDTMGRTQSVSEWQLVGTSGTDLRQTSYTYDAFGRKTSITAADGSLTTFTYGSLGHVDQQQSVAGDTVQIHQILDRQGRLWKISEPSGSVMGAPADVDTTYTYDASSRLRQVLIDDDITPPYTQQIRRFEYDNRGFLVREVHPENGEVLYDDYDARGHAHRVVNGGVLLGPFDLTYSFDGAERLSSVERSDTGRVLKEYVYATANGTYEGATSWDKGRLIEATAHNHWDDTASDMEISEIDHYAGPGGRLSHRTTEMLDHVNAPVVFEQAFTWNDLGQLESVTYPDLAGLAVAPRRKVSSFFTNGQLTAVAGYASSIEHHRNGALKQITHSNGVVDYAGIDPDSINRPRFLSVTAAGGATLWSSGLFAYDGVGNVTEIGTAMSFDYDGVSRLTSATVEGHEQTYEYDELGNLTGLNRDGLWYNLPTDPATNHLQSPATYDSAGNMTSWGDGSSTYTYGYYAFNRLRDLSGAGGDRFYAYTAAGERLLSFASGDGITYTLRNLDGKVLRRFNKQSTTWTWLEDYVWADGRLLASISSTEGIRHYHLDHLGSPRVVTDRCGDLVSEHTYLPFGEELSPTLASGMEPMRFTGHERDHNQYWLTTDDLDYMHARHYNPQLGRFLSVDPMRGRPEVSQSWNRYSYVLNNPLSCTDPDGEWVHIVVGAAIGSGLNMLAKTIKNSVEGKPLTEGLGKAAAVGAVAGAVTAATFGMGAAVLAGGGAAEVAASVATTATATGLTADSVLVLASASSGLGGTIAGAGNEIVVEGNRDTREIVNAAAITGLQAAAVGAVLGPVDGGAVGEVVAGELLIVANAAADYVGKQLADTDEPVQPVGE